MGRIYTSVDYLDNAQAILVKDHHARYNNNGLGKQIKRKKNKEA